MMCQCGAVDCGPFVYSPEDTRDGVIHAVEGCSAPTGSEVQPWSGLHNPERHQVVANPTIAFCKFRGCGRLADQTCTKAEPCRCCLAAEVERLNGLLTISAGKHMSAQERIEAALAICDAGPGWMGIIKFRNVIAFALRGES